MELSKKDNNANKPFHWTRKQHGPVNLTLYAVIKWKNYLK
jgi:hypothetical protein